MTRKPKMLKTDDVRSGLVSAAAGAEQVNEDDAKIRAAAEKRHAAVQADLDELRSRVDADPDAAAHYQKLIAERGRLNIVLAGQ